MGHHSSEESLIREPSMIEEMRARRDRLRNELISRRMEDELAGLGATGRYPSGKMSDADEGEIRYQVASDVERQRVIIDLGKSVRSVGLTKEQAEELIMLLTNATWQLRGITT